MKKNVYIIDNDEVFVRSLFDCLNKTEKYNVVGYSLNAENIISELRSYKNIDFLLVNTLLPMVDGYSLLNNIKKDEEINVQHIIVMQFFINEYVISNFKRLNIDDYILKPCHQNTIINHLNQFNIDNSPREISEQLVNNNSLDKKISLLLHDVGIPASIKGYIYLREAIKKSYYSEDGYLGSVTKRLYPEIAKTFFTTSSRVERAIRHAIEVSFSRGDLNIIAKIFGSTISRIKDKPTNAEFISIFADYLKIENIAAINI